MAEEKQKIKEVKKTEDVSLIHKELQRFEKEVESILKSIESIDLLTIEDTEERLKATNMKVTISIKLPQLLASLDDLRNKAKLKTEQIKGNKDISLWESGALK